MILYFYDVGMGSMLRDIVLFINCIIWLLILEVTVIIGIVYIIHMLVYTLLVVKLYNYVELEIKLKLLNYVEFLPKLHWPTFISSQLFQAFSFVHDAKGAEYNARN